MTEVQQATNLEDLARDQGFYGTTGIVDDHDAVVLGRSDYGWIEIWCKGAVSACAPGTAVMPLTDPGRQAEALRSAMPAVAEKHAATLARIRSYAIDKHLEGQFCQDGLNEFLRTFNLEEYEG